MSRFLPDLIVEGGRLELPGQGHRTATLVLEPGGIRLRAGEATAFLEWEATWGLHPWLHASRGGIGVAVHAPRHPGSDLYLVRHATDGPLRDTLQEIEADDQPGIRIPLRSHGLTPFRDIDTFERLRAFLRARPEARERLGDPGCIRRLREDLARPLDPVAAPGEGILGHALDLHVAIRAAGWTHPDARPAPGTVLEDRTSAIASVKARLELNPWTRGRYTDEEVGEELDRVYFVEPWPFGALLLP